jgi:cell division protein ZapA
MGDGVESDGVARVDIFNRKYGIRGENPEHVKKLAALVNEKMVEVSKLTPTVDTLKVAILAALNIADDCLAAQKKEEMSGQNVTERIERMIAKLEPFCQGESQSAPGKS